jgi:hypothetical protein
LINFHRLSPANCSVSLEKIMERINSWISKKLYLAGRLQLLNSILYNIQVNWIGIFILPKKIIKAIEQKFYQVSLEWEG